MSGLGGFLLGLTFAVLVAILAYLWLIYKLFICGE